MSLALAHTEVMRAQKRVTLHEELAARGITTIPRAIVRKHMHATVKSHRSGIYKIIGPVMYGLSYFLYVLSSFKYVGQTFLGLLAAIALCSGLSFAGIPYASTIALSLGLSSIAFFVWLFVFCELTHVHSPHYNVGLANASSIWMRDRIHELRKSDLLTYSIPERLHTRVMRLRGMNNVGVHKLRFGIDPILEVSRKHGLFTERAYIGGWDTGVAQIDNA